nr:MAG TPA: hypothetical protein [Bacteriophage sp.]
MAFERAERILGYVPSELSFYFEMKGEQYVS